MSVLSRVNWVGQQRLDLHHVLEMESFNAFDLRSFVTSFVGTDKTYVLRGFQVVGKSGRSISIKVSDSLTFNPQDNSGSFYVGLPDDANIIIELPADQSNVYVEARFQNVTQSPVTTGIWDALALSGEDASGQEFTQSVDTQNVLQLEITSNTVGFTEGAIPLVRATTSASDITDMIDAREMLFRLGTGGANPDPLRQFEWSSTRVEPVPNGTGVGNEANSPWRSSDSSGALNDKAFESVKDWMDAVMTRISEISGSAIWYISSGASSPAANLSLNQLFFDTVGHSIQPSKNAAFKWVNNGSGGYKLVGEGSISLVSGTYHSGLIKWQSNNTGLEWHLGGTFVSDTPGGFRNYTAGGLRFDSEAVNGAVVDSGNIYMFLEREVPKGSGDPVIWSPASPVGSLVAARTVSGVVGDFTGIALGDFIRKESEGYSRYLKIVKMYDGVTVFDNASPASENLIADGTIIALELESTIISGTSTEPLRYFRSRYSDTDLFSDNTLDTYLFQDTNFYWLGRREGDLFNLRGYGTMQEGEEATTLDVMFAQGKSSGGGKKSLMLEHGKEAIYGGSGYNLKTGTGNLISIHRLKRDNTVEDPTPGSDNSNAILSYFIDTTTAPVGTLSVGESLWVRLSDTTGAELVSGSVTNTTDDEDNTDTSTNKWEIRTAANTPADTFDNVDVFRIATRLSINSQDSLLFCDGSILTGFGQMLNTNLDVSGEVRLNDYADTAIPFIDETGTKELKTEVGNFFYNETTGTFGVRTFRVTDNQIALSTPANITLFPALGDNTATFGSSDSTFKILGDLIVEGDRIIANTTSVQSEDTLISLGVGYLLGAQGGGVELAENTDISSQVDTTNTSSNVVLTFTGVDLTPDYTVGESIEVSATEDVGGITAEQMSGRYTVVAGAPGAGDIQIVFAAGDTTLEFISGGTATSTASSTTDTPRVFDAPWSIRLGDAQGNYTDAADVTSWVFRVRDTATAPTLTPVTSYGVVPTAHSANMVSMRIPFTNDDNAGPSDDSTLNFSGDLKWDDSGKNLTVDGNIVNETPNTYDIGDATNTWKILYLGSSATSGIRIGASNLYETSADRLKTDDQLEIGDYLILDKHSEYVEFAAFTAPTIPPSGSINVFARDGLMFQQENNGEQKLLTNEESGSVYEENAYIVPGADPLLGTDGHRGPVGLNVSVIGSGVTATTTISTPTVSVALIGHGLITGDYVRVLAAESIGGIPVKNLRVTNTIVTVIDPDTFEYTALSDATSSVAGTLDAVLTSFDPLAETYADQTLPLDTRGLVGANVQGTTVAAASGNITLAIPSHGLVATNIITVEMTAAIDGISAATIAGNYTAVVGAPAVNEVEIVDADTLIINTGGSAAVGSIVGTINRVVTTKVRQYIVGLNELEIELNGIIQERGFDYDVIGVLSSLSNSIRWLRELKVGDVWKARIDSNGGLVVFNQNTGGSLQGAYDGGNTILITTGVPVVISAVGAPTTKALSVIGDLDVSGLIDPTGLVLDEQASTPLSASQSGIYSSNNAAKDFIYGRNGLSDINMTQSFLYRDGTKAMLANLPMGGFKITGAGNPTSAQDLTTKFYTDGTFLRIDGATAATGNINLDNTYKVVGSVAPTADGDLTNKKFIDDNFLRIDGSVAVTGNIDLDNTFKVVNSVAPTAGADLTNKTYVDSKDRYAAIYFDGTNNTGGSIIAGSVVYVSNTSGEIELAKADAVATAQGTIGVVPVTILNTDTGKVQISGLATVNGGVFTAGPVYISTTTAGEGQSTEPITNSVSFVLGSAYSSTQVVLNPYLKRIYLGANIYEEILTVVSGAPADDNEITGPVSAGTNMTLPLDSRNSNAAKTYVVGQAQMEIMHNEFVLRRDSSIQGYNEPNTTQFSVNRDAVVGDKFVIRIEPD